MRGGELITLGTRFKLIRIKEGFFSLISLLDVSCKFRALIYELCYLHTLIAGFDILDEMELRKPLNKKSSLLTFLIDSKTILCF